MCLISLYLYYLTIQRRLLFPGMLSSTLDDPYDFMRRNRLSIESAPSTALTPRPLRAQSSSPMRQVCSQRDQRTQSVARNLKDRIISKTTSAIATVSNSINNNSSIESEPVSRTEWFDTVSSPLQVNGNNRHYQQQSNNDVVDNSNINNINNNINNKTSPNLQQQNGISRLNDLDDDWPRPGVNRTNFSNNWAKALAPPSCSVPDQLLDSRKSILECSVNPYLLLGKKKEDLSDEDLSDDLSDNAVEREKCDEQSLFDSSKVKSIERTPNRSAVAAIGGQRIRVFNELTKELSDEDDIVPLTRIPIPKIVPKRPPRRLKEAKTVIRSILKRVDRSKSLEFLNTKHRKSVCFKVDNVILAPEKPPELCIPRPKQIQQHQDASLVKEQGEQPEQETEKPQRFFNVPNVSRPDSKRMLHDSSKFVSKVLKGAVPPIEKIKIDKFVPSKKLVDHKNPQVGSQQKKVSTLRNQSQVVKHIPPPPPRITSIPKPSAEEVREKSAMERDKEVKCNNRKNDNFENTIKTKKIAVDEKDMIDKCEGKQNFKFVLNFYFVFVHHFIRYRSLNFQAISIFNKLTFKDFVFIRNLTS